MVFLWSEVSQSAVIATTQVMFERIAQRRSTSLRVQRWFVLSAIRKVTVSEIAKKNVEKSELHELANTVAVRTILAKTVIRSMFAVEAPK